MHVGYLRAQVPIARVVLGPQRAVSTPLSTCMLSLNLALVGPTQITDSSVSSAAQLVGQPFDEQLSEVTVRMLLPDTPAGPGGPGGPAMPGSPLAPTSPERSLQPANATVAARIAINVGIRILDPLAPRLWFSSLRPAHRSAGAVS